MTDPVEEGLRVAWASEDTRPIMERAGRHDRSFVYPSEWAAGKAWRRVIQKARFIACWRFCSLDRRTWYVVVMGEELADVERGARRANVHGAQPVADPPQGMREGLRDRRRRMMVEDALRGGGGQLRITHTPAGMRMDTRGRMTPHTRPQG